MDDLLDVRHVTVSIRRAPSDVYAFVIDGEKVPLWAAGLGTTMRRVNGDWIADGTLGSVRVHFTPPNDFGVADHDVTLPTGETVRNAIRVLPNASGSTVVFTLFRLPGVSEQEFDADMKAVERDLQTLKRVLEDAG